MQKWLTNIRPCTRQEAMYDRIKDNTLNSITVSNKHITRHIIHIHRIL